MTVVQEEVPPGLTGRTVTTLRGAARTARAPLRILAGLGWATVVCTVAAVLVGRRYGWAELVVAGCILGITVVLALLLTVGRSHYAVDLDLADRHVTVGERAMGRIEVRNIGRRRLLPAHIELPVGTGAAGFALPSMAAGAVHD